jgi:hypothetical protein
MGPTQGTRPLVLVTIPTRALPADQGLAAIQQSGSGLSWTIRCGPEPGSRVRTALWIDSLAGRIRTRPAIDRFRCDPAIEP